MNEEKDTPRRSALFSYRSMFRVDRVRSCGNNEFWFIDVTLIDENDEQYKSIMHPW